MRGSATRGTRRPLLFRRLFRDRRGVTTLEFAIVAAPFLALLLGIFETSWIFVTGSALQGALLTASRQIRSGAVQAPATASPGQTAAARANFSGLVCQSMPAVLIDCANLQVDAHSVSSFGSIPNLPSAIGDNTFQTGGPSTIVAVRVAYPSVLAFPFGSPNYWMQYMIVLQTEPYQT